MAVSRPGRSLSAVLLCSLVLVLSSGCAGTGNPKPPASAPIAAGAGGIEEINLLAMPVALNLNEQPGVDGFAIKIYANNRRRPKSLPLEDGKLEVQMYDGIPGITSGASTEPLRTWSYTAEELKRFEIQTSIGIAYQFAPLWGDAVPRHNKIGVLVRYTSKNGVVISSAPSIIDVALK